MIKSSFGGVLSEFEFDLVGYGDRSFSWLRTDNWAAELDSPSHLRPKQAASFGQRRSNATAENRLPVRAFQLTIKTIEYVVVTDVGDDRCRVAYGLITGCVQ